MAAGIAHEIRNPLASMSGSIQVLRQELPLSDEQAQLMDIVLRESERLNDTIRSFLAYARPQRVSAGATRRAEGAFRTPRSCCGTAPKCSAHHIDRRRRAAEPVWCEADENQIRQIVWNLATNGLRAMANGGRLLLTVDARNVSRRQTSGSCSRSRTRAAASRPRSSTASFSRSAARSSEAPASAWQPCTASSPTTTGRSRCRPSWCAGRPCACGCRSTRASARRRRASESRERGRMSASIDGNASAATRPRAPSRRRQAAHPRRRRRAVDARDAAHRASARRLRRDGGRERDARRSTSCSATAIDLLLSDIRMPDISGVEVLRAAKEANRDIVAFMMTAFASTDTAVEAMRLGAVDYFTKPFNMDELRLKVRQHLETHRLKQENVLLKRALNTPHEFSNIIGRSDAMLDVFKMIETIAKTNSTVLITGESGTGKELVARAIHYNSLRREHPFVALNCGALPETLLESELFGHMRGAFTGADTNKKGLVEVAERGTIFLDEIGEMNATMQVKLLRVLQDRRFRRLGGTEEVQADIRVIAATNQDLQKMVAEGRFREDLYYRINVIQVQLPPLRDRREDIPLLAEHFLTKYAKAAGKAGARHFARGAGAAGRV